MQNSPELRAWLEQLQEQDHKLGRQNRVLMAILATSILAALIVLWTLYRSTVGGYAALDDVSAIQNPANPGRIDFSFRVARAGQVSYQRRCGARVSEMADYFHTTGETSRSWSWTYTPGEDLVATIWYRCWFLRRRQVWRFPTSRLLDVVVLIDTSQSMGTSIQQIKTPCSEFSERMIREGWQPRYSIVAFGSEDAKPWLHCEPPTNDPLDFIVAVDQVPRFADGPSLGGSLSALEEALSTPLREGSARRFVLITDNGYHPTTDKGATAASIAERLAQKHIRLDVFSSPQWQAEYAPLVGAAGHFYPLERFRDVMAEGHLLED